MDTKSIVFGILLSFAVGFYFGTVTESDQTTVGDSYNKAAWETKVSQISKRLNEIEQKEIEEYTSIKSDREKYLKANEIYGKVLQLFLGQLDVKVDVNKWEKINPSLKLYLEDFNETYEMNKDGNVDFAISPTAAHPIENHENNVDESINMWDRIAKLVKSDSLYDDGGIILNPKEFMAAAKTITELTPILDILQGHFEGQININNSDLTINVDMNIDYTYNGKHYFGKSQIRLDQKGKEANLTMAEGENKNFRINNQDQDSLIIVLADGSFLHVVYHAVKQTFSGHYYRVNPEAGEYQAVGQLTRLSKIP